MRFLVPLILLTLFLSCQSVKTTYNKTISPRFGEIVFVKQAEIYDSIAFEKSKKSYTKKFLSSLKETINKDSLKSTSNKLWYDQKLNFIESNFNNLYFNQIYNSKRKYFYVKLLDSLIMSYNKVDGKVLGDYYVENISKNTSYRLAKSDSLTTYSLKKMKQLENNFNNSDLIIDKKDTKIIDGYKCFKIIFKEEVIFDKVFKIKTNYSMYVTEEIKLKHHPSFKNKFILEKYYPLKIIENSDGVKGAKIVYTLKKIVLN